MNIFICCIYIYPKSVRECGISTKSRLIPIADKSTLIHLQGCAVDCANLSFGYIFLRLGLSDHICKPRVCFLSYGEENRFIPDGQRSICWVQFVCVFCSTCLFFQFNAIMFSNLLGHHLSFISLTLFSTLS